MALAMLGLSLFSCNEDQTIKESLETGIETRFELGSSLGSVGIESLDNNTNEDREQLRASLHFNGTNKVATTTLVATDFGLRMGLNGYSLDRTKINARWGVIYGSGQFASANCKTSLSSEPNDASTLTENAVLFTPNTIGHTIEGAKLKMYCQSVTNLNNIKKGIMCLDGVEGRGADASKQYFMAQQGGRAIATDPNERIEGVKLGSTTLAMQEKRHIPIMTALAPYGKLTATTPEVKFIPRGSLIGLCVKNKLDEDITITGIVVDRTSALDFSGYFDLAQTTAVKGEDRARFTAEYPAGTASELVFPVYSKGATSTGYHIAPFGATQDEMTELSCFFVWGFQKATKQGADFKVQLRYKLGTGSKELTTRTFKIHAPNSKLETGKKQFDDGYAYNTILTIDKTNATTPTIDPNIYTADHTVLDYFAPAFVSKNNYVEKNYSNGYADDISSEWVAERNTTNPQAKYDGYTRLEPIAGSGFDFDNEETLYPNHPRNHVYIYTSGTSWALLFPMKEKESSGTREEDSLQPIITGAPLSQPTTIQKFDTKYADTYDFYGWMSPVLKDGWAYIQSVPDPNHPSTSIVYAIRSTPLGDYGNQNKGFIAAWQYRWEGSIATNDQCLIVSTVSLNYTSATFSHNTPDVEAIFEQMKLPKFFDPAFTGTPQKPHIVDQLVIPYYGYRDTESGPIIRDKGTPFNAHRITSPYPKSFVLPSNPSEQMYFSNQFKDKYMVGLPIYSLLPA